MIEGGELLQRSTAIGKTFEARARQWQKKWPVVGEIRGIGAMCAIELVRNRETREPAEGETKEGGAVPIRLLLADDHRMLREGLRRSMTDEGFDVVGEAGDGLEAVRLADELLPDVVLMDVTMPEMDGVEAARGEHRQGDSLQS